MSDKCVMKINCDNDDFVAGEVLTGLSAGKLFVMH